jgi:predicted ABC-type ATPase
MPPTLYVIAGPAGSGKSSVFRLDQFGVDFFNVDDHAAALHGSYVGIPAEVRARAGAACETFVREHITDRQSFAVETTLRTMVSIDQARDAKAAGFATVLIYVGTSDPEINVERVRLRGLAGGHSAPAEQIRGIYAASLANLRRALEVFDHVRVYDNSVKGAAPSAEAARVDEGVISLAADAPAWVVRLLAAPAP